MGKYILEFTEEQVKDVFKQAHFAMKIDYRQHTFLGEGHQREHADDFLQRQQIRFSILAAISDAFTEGLPVSLRSQYKEAEGMMLFARGFGDVEGGGTDTTTT